MLYNIDYQNINSSQKTLPGYLQCCEREQAGCTFTACQIVLPVESALLEF
jgi:hypothetical protein